MADRRDMYFRQLVTEGDLDEIHTLLEAADRAVISDIGLHGLIVGGLVTENSPTPNLSVLVHGPLFAYDQLGQRVSFQSPTQAVDASTDENGASTIVTTPGNERVVSIFIEFERFPSNPKVDGNDVTVFYDLDEGFKFNVVKAAEYTPPAPPVLPALRSDQLLLADITLAHGDTQIFNAAIDSVTRREDAFRLAGATDEIVAGKLKDALQLLLDYIEDTKMSAARRMQLSMSLFRVITGDPPSSISDSGNTIAWVGGGADSSVEIPLTIITEDTITELASQLSVQTTGTLRLSLFENGTEKLYMEQAGDGILTTPDTGFITPVVGASYSLRVAVSGRGVGSIQAVTGPSLALNG